MPVAVGERAPEVTFGRSYGPDVTLSELCQERPVVLAFLRHFG